SGVLAQIKDLLSDGGTVYLRTHPFCSRHATHLYHKINIYSESDPDENNETVSVFLLSNKINQNT
ncbi:MAG: hypothetical protein WCK26_04340, partial [Candidatus Saccharibacteria bacterium]